jgi:hypothetical protein
MAAARAKKEKPPPGPDDLVRESAGAYRSGDERFRVEKSDVGWYLIDNEQANEFGQQLIHGPLPTLDAVREQMPGARELKPLLRVRPPTHRATTSRDATKSQRPVPAPPPPPPPTWIDRLPAKEATEVRRLIRALEREGLADADEMVKRHRDDPTPVIATRLIEQRLRALIDAQPEKDRERAQALVREVARILGTGGATVERPAPRWALVEVRDGEEMSRSRLRPLE